MKSQDEDNGRRTQEALGNERKEKHTRLTIDSTIILRLVMLTFMRHRSLLNLSHEALLTHSRANVLLRLLKITERSTVSVVPVHG
jgi:hypothetical protein